ncbi:MAG: hypothetical protein AAF410_04865 [Pseudomonadota bacterium]
MKKSLYLGLLLMILQNMAFAYDTSGNYAVWGTGKKSCFSFQKDQKDENIQKYKHYMKGFITAYNVFTEKTYSISSTMNETQIFEWINAYCDDNPMSSFEGALTEFTFDHYDDRSKSAKSYRGGGGW